MNEELGIPVDSVEIGKILTAIEDQRTRAVDVIVHATTQMAVSDICACFSKRRTDEYDEIRVVNDEKIKEFTRHHKDNFVGTALNALDFMGLL